MIELAMLDCRSQVHSLVLTCLFVPMGTLRHKFMRGSYLLVLPNGTHTDKADAAAFPIFARCKLLLEPESLRASAKADP